MSRGGGRRLRRWVARALWVVLVLGLVAGAGAAVLVGTEGGARWAFGFAQRYGVEVAEIRGRLLGPLHLEGVAWAGPDFELRVGRVDVDWRPGALRARTLELRSIRSGGVELTLLAPAEPPPEEAARLPTLSLPLRVMLEELEVKDLRIRGPDGEILALLELGAGAEARGSTVVVRRLSLSGDDFAVRADGRAELRDDHPLSLAFAWDGVLPDGSALEGRGVLEGTVAHLRLDHRLTAPVDAELNATVKGFPGPPEWRARFRVDRAAPGSFLPDAPVEWVSLAGDASGSATDARIALGFEAAGTELGDLSGALEAATDGRVLHLERFRAGGRLAEAEVSAEGTGTVQLREGPSGELSFGWSASVPGRPRLTGRGHLDGDLSRVAFRQQLEAPVAIDLRGTVDDLRGAARWTAELRAPSFPLDALDPALPDHRVSVTASATGDRTSLSGDAGLTAQVGPHHGSARGRFAVTGTPASYSTRIEGSLEAEGIPQVALRLRGHGGGTAYEVDSLTVEGPAGRLTGRGRVSWDAALAWEAAVDAAGIVLEELGSPVPGRLEAEASGDGLLTADGMRASVRLPRLVYEDEDRRVLIDAEGSLDGAAFHLAHLRLTAGENRLQARGSLGDEWEVGWELEAPDLAVGAGLAGRARGTGGISGARLRLRAWAELEAGGISAPGFSVDTADVSISVDLTDRDPSSVRVLVAGSAGEGRPFGTRIRGDGRLAGHGLELAGWNGDGDSVSVGVSGALQLSSMDAGGGAGRARDAAAGVRWEGEVTRTVLAHPVAGEWRLRAPAALRASPEAVALDRACLDSGGADACIAGRWERAEGGRAGIDIRGLALERAEEVLPPGLRVAGTGSLSAEATLDGDGALSGRAGMDVEGGRLRHASMDGVEQARELEEARAGVELDPDGSLRGWLRVRLAEGGGVEGELASAPGPAGRAWGPDTGLSGRLAAELHDRGFLGAASDGLWGTEGVLRASLLMEGTAGAPRLTGEVRLEDAFAEVPELGIRVEGIHLTARDRAPDEWELEGGARSGTGSVRLAGTALLPGPGRAGSVLVEVDGEDFQVANNGMARVDVSPSLRGAAGADRLEVTGEIRVPRADITPGDMEGMVSASPDVVIVGVEEEAEVPALPNVPNLRARVRVVMGDSVRVDGFGVTGRVTGAVTVVEEPGRLTSGQGELRLLDGEYTAARQRLTIERGRLVYADRPLEDPGLDVRVVRRTPEVLAGMEIRGTAREPEVTIFSEPAMPEAEAMAYLLIGRPIRGTGQGDGALMERMATSMGLAGGAALLGRLGPALGLAEARIERGERLSDAALVVGTRFTPRLFVSYGLGLFGGSTSVLRLRYQLAEHWILRSESGEELGADLLYSVER